MIIRQIESLINKRLGDKKALIVLGSRQCGKTTVLEKLFSSRNDVLWMSGDEPDERMMLQNVTSTELKTTVGSNKILVIDEAQRIENIGLTIKLFTDKIKNVKVIATGSSSFELSDKINEPLTGRKWEFMLFPVSYSEMVRHHGLINERRLLEHRLVYGYYPEVIMNPGDEIEVLKQLANSYLYKDILTFEKVKKPQNLERLVQALAFQVGNEVSYHELGKMCGLDNETVEKYILLLERAFIVFRIGSYSRNLRSELKKSRKIYFYDNGIRNAVISQFNPLGLRNDIGALWENFIISERMKYNAYNGNYVNTYFWRTKDQQEIDLIEESDGQINAFEFKWSEDKLGKVPNVFVKAYPRHQYMVISKTNYENFIL